MKFLKARQYLGWFFAGFFLLAGLLIYCFLVGYSFSAYLCFGISLILCIYEALAILQRTQRQATGILRLTVSALLCLGLLAAFATGIPIAKAALAQPAPNCRYIVVLGAGLHGSVPSLTLMDRLNAAADYLIANPDTVCIVSGGQGPGEDMTEASCMEQILIEKGITPQRIWKEERSTSTYENLQFSMQLIQHQTGERPQQLGIVSSEYHVYRACMTAQSLNITPLGIPAKTSKISLFLNYFLREIPAVWYYGIFTAAA